LLKIDWVQYAMRRLFSMDSRRLRARVIIVGAFFAVFFGVIQLHNFPARIRWARSFAVFVEMDANDAARIGLGPRR
jgi:hypothetical protein